MTRATRVVCLALPDGSAPEPVLERLVAGLGGLVGRVFPGARVLLKPNLVAPFQHATTDLAWLEFFVGAVRALGGIAVVGETSGFEFDTRATFDVLGVAQLAARLNVPLINFEEAGYDAIELGSGVGRVELARAALNADLIVNLPLLKGHSVTGVTCAVKNLFGLLSKPSRRRAHAAGLHTTIRAVARHLAPRALHFADARRPLRRAVFAEAEPLGYVLASSDAFALDHLACRLIAVRPESVRHLGGAPPHEVVGDAPSGFPQADERRAAVSPLRRAAYAVSYALDHAQSKVLPGGASLLPALHWHLGVHPELREGLSRTEMTALVRSCPVGAIDPDHGIRRERCAPVRCLACHREHPNLVRLGGLNPPTRNPNARAS